MSKARHKAKKAMGGGVSDQDTMPADGGGDPNVKTEAKAKTVGIIGDAGRKRIDRARGGRVGADKSPMSASSSKHPISSAGKC